MVGFPLSFVSFLGCIYYWVTFLLEIGMHQYDKSPILGQYFFLNFFQSSKDSEPKKM